MAVWNGLPQGTSKEARIAAITGARRAGFRADRISIEANQLPWLDRGLYASSSTGDPNTPNCDKGNC